MSIEYQLKIKKGIYISSGRAHNQDNSNLNMTRTAFYRTDRDLKTEAKNQLLAKI